jgi:hypothetical protein
MVIAAVMLALAPAGAVPADDRCTSPETGAIVVCGSGSQPYRIDPDVAAGAKANARDLDGPRAAVPAAQAACAQSPMGCGKGLESVDIANVAIVAGTMAVKAATGGDWTKPLRPAGPGEYQRYQESKRLREEQSAARAAIRQRDAARIADATGH